VSFFRRKQELGSTERDAMKPGLETNAIKSKLRHAAEKIKIGVPPKKSDIGRSLEITTGLGTFSAPTIKNMVDEHRKREGQ